MAGKQCKGSEILEILQYIMQLILIYYTININIRKKNRLVTN
jgi:hypothetical protein